jgi:hypothetical protein
MGTRLSSAWVPARPAQRGEVSRATSSRWRRLPPRSLYLDALARVHAAVVNR